MASKITSATLRRLIIDGIAATSTKPAVPPPPSAPTRPPGRTTMAIVAEWKSGAPPTLLAEVEHIAAAVDRLEELRVEWSKRPAVGSVTYRKGSSLVLDVHGDDTRHWCEIRPVIARVIDYAGAPLMADIVDRADDYR